MSPVGPAFTSRRKKEEKKNTKKFVLSYPALHQHTYNQLPIHFHLSSSSPSITQFMNNNIHHRSTSTKKKKKLTISPQQKKPDPPQINRIPQLNIHQRQRRNRMHTRGHSQKLHSYRLTSQRQQRSAKKKKKHSDKSHQHNHPRTDDQLYPMRT